jgi:hypothetical protein
MVFLLPAVLAGSVLQPELVTGQIAVTCRYKGRRAGPVAELIVGPVKVSAADTVAGILAAGAVVAGIAGSSGPQSRSARRYGERKQNQKNGSKPEGNRSFGHVAFPLRLPDLPGTAVP